MPPMGDATSSLAAHVAGDERAVDRLIPLVYQELRRLASHLMKGERQGHILPPTALVHEAYVRLVDNSRVDWQGKTHFFAVAAEEMRRVLVEHARRRGAKKRGADFTKVSMSDNLLLTSERDINLLALDEALTKLESLSPRQCKVVELRLFSGLGVAEAAYILNVSERTVKGDLRMARTWLARELTDPQGEG